MAADAERSRGGGRVKAVKVILVSVIVTVRVVFRVVVAVAAATATVRRRLKIIVPSVEPKLKDLSDEFRREEGRLKDRRDSREMLLRVPLEPAGVSDSYEVWVHVIGGYLGTHVIGVCSRYLGTGAEE